MIKILNLHDSLSSKIERETPVGLQYFSDRIVSIPYPNPKEKIMYSKHLVGKDPWKKEKKKMNMVFKKITILNRVKNWILCKLHGYKYITIPATGSFATITPCPNCDTPAFWIIETENSKPKCMNCGYEKEKGEE